MRPALSIAAVLIALACAGRRPAPAPLPDKQEGPLICAETPEFIWEELPRPDGGVSPLSPGAQERLESPPDGGAP